MSEYIVGNEYENTVRGTAQALMPFVRMAEVSAEVTTNARGSSVVFPMTVLPTATDPTALALNEGSGTPITNDDRDVTIPLEILGESYHVYDGVASLQETVANRALNSKVKAEAVIAANTLDYKAAAAVMAIDVDGSAFVHPMGPDDQGAGVMGWTSPVEAGLLHIGPDATSLDDAAELASDDYITAGALRRMVQTLVNRNIQPKGYLDAGDLNTFLYGCILTDQQMLDLRGEVGENSIVSTNKYMASDGRVLAGTYRIWENLILQTSTRAKEVVSPEEGDDFYAHRAIVYGRDYLGMGATPAPSLPVADNRVERIVMFAEMDASDNMNPQGSQAQIPRVFEIRKVPANDAQGRLSNIAWLAHCGFKLLSPLSGIQLITRASNDPAIV